MATRTFLTTGNWLDAATWAEGIIPTEADDVVFTAGGGTLTVNGVAATPALCRSIDCTGFTGTLTMGATAVLQYGDQNGSGAGVFKIVSGMTFVPNSAAVINCVSSSSGNNITTAGKTLCFINFNGTGSWQLQDNFTSTSSISSVTLTKGGLDINGKTMTVGLSFLSNNSNVRSLTLGTGTISVNISGIFDITTSTNMTMSAASGTITMGATSTAVSFNGGGLTYGTVTFSSITSGVITVSGSNTITTLTMSCTTGNITVSGSNTITTCTCTGVTTGWMQFSAANSFTTFSLSSGASQFATYVLGGTQTVSGTFTLNGSSVINRVLIKSTVNGTRVTISAATVASQHSDWLDITGAGASGWNLSAITGNSGDCGNNSGITFTSPATSYWVPSAGTSTGSMSAVTRYANASNGTAGTGRAPLPQDTTNIDASSIDAGSRTITCDMPRIGTINWTGATNTPAWAKSSAGGLLIPGTLCFGSVTLVSAMTNSGTTNFTFAGRGSNTFTSATQTWTNPIVIDCAAGTITQQDNLASSSNIGAVGDLIGTSGTWTGGAHTVTLSGASANLIIQGASVTFGGTLTLSGATAAKITVSSGLLDCTGQTVSHAGAGSTVSFTGGTFNFGTLTRTALTCTFSGTTVTAGTAIACSTLTNAAGTVTINGTVTCSAGVSNSGGTVAFNGAVSCTTFGVTGAAVTATANITGTGAASGSSGSLSMASNTLSCTTYANTASGVLASIGTLTCSSTITISCTGNGTTIGTGGCTCTTFNQSGIGGSFITAASGLLSCSSTFTCSGGTFTDGGGGVSATTFSITSSSTRQITMAGTWTASGTGSVWDATLTGSLTFIPGNSTLAITNTSATTTAFITGGLTYWNVTISGAASVGICTLSLAGTFHTFTANQDASLKFTITTTYTATTWTLTGTSGHVITVVSSTAATKFTLATPAYTITQWNWVSLKDCQATLATQASWYAGANSTNVSGNAGWSFNSGPSTVALNATGGNFSATTAWTGSQVPQPADDVTVGVGAGNLTIDGVTATPSSCRSIDFTGYTGTLTMGGTAELWIGDSGGGKLIIATGMTFSPTSGALMRFKSTWATQVGITTNGKSMPAIEFNGVGGSWQLQDAITPGTNGLVITLTNGSLDTNGKAVGSASLAYDFTASGSATRSLTLGATTWTYSTTWNAVSSTGLTVSAASSTITTGSTAIATTTFQGGGLTWGTYAPVYNNTGNRQIVGANTFGTLTLDASTNASVANLTTLANSITVSGTLSMKGNSVSNRLMVKSSVAGTQMTITAATIGTCQHLVLIDIGAAGAGNWDLHAITGGCGGGTTATNCSGITFTAGQTNYWVPATATGTSTGSFSTAANWASSSHGASGTGRPPMPQDIARFDAYSFNMTGYTVTQDLPYTGSIDFTGTANTPTFTKSTACAIAGSITFVTGMTVSSNAIYTFVGADNVTMTTAGNIFNALTLAKPSGSLTVADSWTTASNVTITSGTLITSTPVTLTGLVLNGSGAVYTPAATVTMSAALSVSAGNINAAGITFTGGSTFTTATGGTVTVGNMVLTGAMTINGCTVTITSATLASACTTLTMTTGSLTLGFGGLNNSLLTWNGGTITTNGPTVVTLGSSISVKARGPVFASPVIVGVI